MKNLFLQRELHQVEVSKQRYHIAQRRTDHTFGRAKMNARLLAASPAALLTFFGFGAYKGATTDNPPSRRRQAVVTFLRTIVLNAI